MHSCLEDSSAMLVEDKIVTYTDDYHELNQYIEDVAEPLGL